jgi:hypothetical protein
MRRLEAEKSCSLSGSSSTGIRLSAGRFAYVENVHLDVMAITLVGMMVGMFISTMIDGTAS